MKKSCAMAVALVCMLPVATAATRVEGELAFAQPARLDGAVALLANEGALDLAPAVLARSPVALTFASASGYRVDTVGTVPDGAPLYLDGETTSTPLEYGAGRIALLACESPCEAFVHARGGQVALAGGLTGSLGWTRAATPHFGTVADPDFPNAFSYEVGAGWLVARAGTAAGEGPLLTLAQASVAGAVGLLLWNATAELAADGETERFETGASWREQELAPGVSVAREKRTSYVYLELEDAALEAAPDAPLYFFATGPTLDLDGELASASATGWIRAGADRHELAEDEVRIVGALRLAPEPDEASALSVVTGGRSDGARFSGDARLVQVGDEEVARAGEATAIVLTVGTLTLAALLVLALKSGALTALYTRVSRGSVLDHDKRRRIYDEITTRPGIGVADLARATRSSRAVVMHHLHMLVAHRFVTQREGGATRGYFSVDKVVAASDFAAQLLLKDATRRRIAEAILADPAGATQKDLVESLGISQRLVSYHLARLEKLQLLEGEGSRPRRFHATVALRGAIEATSHAPTHLSAPA